MVEGKGYTNRSFSRRDLASLFSRLIRKPRFEGRRVLAILPDSTRSGPTDLFFRTCCRALLPSVAKLDFLIALGTHPAMEDEKLRGFLGITGRDSDILKKVGIFQHRWDAPDHLRHIGTIRKEEIARISDGLMAEAIPVTINRRVFDYDQLILIGPVFPHEVVGFSGGYKYLFPGISGPEFLHRFHWLGALITNPRINGTRDTPVREAINRAASFLKIPMTLVCCVVKEKRVHGLYAGDVEAWAAAAELSGRINIRYVPRTYHTVLSMAPAMYDDIWTAGKCMYKLEPVVTDGGTLIIYAPHIREISYTHGQQIQKVGYHTRDYFLRQMDRFRDVPGCIVAHSTHVRGIGTYRDGVEKPRINVVLATGIPEEKCRAINLGYRDPRTIRLRDYSGKEKQGILMVRDAGEVLFRLADGTVPDIDRLYEKEGERSHPQDRKTA